MCTICTNMSFFRAPAQIRRSIILFIFKAVYFLPLVSTVSRSSFCAPLAKPQSFAFHAVKSQVVASTGENHRRREKASLRSCMHVDLCACAFTHYCLCLLHLLTATPCGETRRRWQQASRRHLQYHKQRRRNTRRRRYFPRHHRPYKSSTHLQRARCYLWVITTRLTN